MAKHNSEYDPINVDEGVQRKSSRVIGLDLLRISLALLIYIYHSWLHFGCSYFYLDDFVSVGATAMTGFFLLSGYSLRLVYGEQDLMEKHILGRFYLKRIVSIIPLYYFFALLYILFCGEESLVDNVLLFPIEALGLQTTFTSLFEVTHNAGTWFISCILLAYLIYPFLQTICRQVSVRFKSILLIVLVMIEIWACYISHRFDTVGLYENPFYRVLEFSCGLLVADINIKYDNKIRKAFRSWGMLISSVVVLIAGISLMSRYLRYEDYMQYNVIVLPCFITMLFALGTIKMPILEKSKIIPYLSKISYAFFLAQFFAWDFGRMAITFIGLNNKLLRILYSLSFCIIVSVLAYELIQKPIVKYVKKRYGL